MRIELLSSQTFSKCKKLEYWHFFKILQISHEHIFSQVSCAPIMIKCIKLLMKLNYMIIFRFRLNNLEKPGFWVVQAHFRHYCIPNPGMEPAIRLKFWSPTSHRKNSAEHNGTIADCVGIREVSENSVWTQSGFLFVTRYIL